MALCLLSSLVKPQTICYLLFYNGQLPAEFWSVEMLDLVCQDPLGSMMSVLKYTHDRWGSLDEQTVCK